MALVLLIDDSSWWLKRMSNLIQQMGHDVLTRNGMKEGLAAADAQSPDCIVTDLLMPDGDGFQVLRHLNETGKKIPTVVLTADFQQETIDLCKELGAFEVIQKERVKNMLADILRRALEKTTEKDTSGSEKS